MRNTRGSLRLGATLFALSAGLGIPKDKINAAIEAAGLPASVRAESLGMENLARLSECIAAQCR